MTRTILATAIAALAATLFTSAADACISCEYVPEVVRSGEQSHEAKPSRSYKAKSYKKERSYTATEERRARPAKRIVESETVIKRVETADTAPIKTPAENENSTISTATLDASETITPNEEAQVTKTAGCKKFFPSVGLTHTVACE